MASVRSYDDDQPSYGDGQPGLEVIHPETGLQVSYPPQEWSYAVPNEEGQKEVVSPTDIFRADLETEEAVSSSQKIFTRKTLLIALLVIVVIVGVIVGAVVRTAQSQSLPPSPPSTTPDSPSGKGDSASISSPAQMTGNPTSVWPGLAPTAVSWGYPHLEIFALTRNRTESVYRKYRDTNATDENDFTPSGYDMELVGGNVDANTVPSIGVNQRISYYVSNQTQIFLQTQGNCWGKLHENDQLWTPPGYDSWTSCFTNLSVTGAPTVVPYNASAEVAQAFYLATGTNETDLAAYYTKWQPQDEWSVPARILGPALQPMKPAAVAWNGNDSRVDIFVVSESNSHVLHASWDTTITNDPGSTNWSAYEDLQGFATTPPVAVSRSPGIIDLFIRGGDAGLWYLSYNSSNKNWSGWSRISTNMSILGQPDAVSASPETVDVFAWREDGCLLHKSFDNGSGRWTPEEDFDVLVDGSEGKLSGPPKAVSDGPGSIHVFAYQDQKSLIWKRLSAGSSGQVASNVSVLASVPSLT